MKITLLLFCTLRALVITAQPETLQQALQGFNSRNQDAINKHWDDLSSAHKIPLVIDDSVAFLYRGEAQTVKWTGDFNGWEYDKSFNNNGTRIPGTDIWILKAAFPKDARLDYKLIVDKQWILDPENKYQQLSGVGAAVRIRS
jgi:hypothetical protein